MLPGCAAAQFLPHLPHACLSKLKYTSERRNLLLHACCAALAGIAKKYGVHIQSHISECCGEVMFSRHLHPEFKSDAEVFDDVGLLTNKVVAAA